MFYFYIFTIIVGWSYFLSKRLGFGLIIVIVPIFLIFLPTTGLDYDYYKLSYDSAYYMPKFPFFHSNSVLTAEPLYIWYTSFISVVTKISFPYFLSLNFLLCSFMLNYSLKKVGGFSSSLRSYFFIYLLPVIIPTIFYFSPRSSISFCFVLLGFLTLSFQNKLKLGALFLFIGFSFHSQYILISMYILAIYILKLRMPSLKKIAILNINLISSVLLFLFLVLLPFLENIVNSLFSFLPSASIALAKLHYVSGDAESGNGFRITAILSIIIYPILALLMLNKYDKHNSLINENFVFCVVGVVLFGAVVNLVFINDPHVAGRLSRFSDYFSMGLLLPYTLFIYKKQLLIKATALITCLISPLLFKTLYIDAFGIF